MDVFEEYEIWFVTSSQSRYRDEVLDTAATHAREVVEYLSNAGEITG